MELLVPTDNVPQTKMQAPLSTILPPNKNPPSQNNVTTLMPAQKPNKLKLNHILPFFVFIANQIQNMQMDMKMCVCKLQGNAVFDADSGRILEY